MATTAERTAIIKLTVAMYNAGPGATYLAELTSFYDTIPGTDSQFKLGQLARAMSETASYKALNPVTQTATQFAAAFLTPFGLQANQEALDYINARFATTNKGQLSFDAALLIANYAGSDAAIKSAGQILVNKYLVGEYAAVTKVVAQTDVTVLKNSISTVTATATTVASAKARLDANSDSMYAAANVFALTAGTDAVVASAISDLITAGTDGFLVTADNINGSTGIDTLTANVTAAAQTISPTTTSVEYITLTVTPAAGQIITFTGTNVSGATMVTVKAVGTFAAADVINVTTLNKTVTLGIEAGSAGAAAPAITATFAGVLATDTQKVAISAAGQVSTLTLSTAENVEITATDAGNVIGSLAATAVRALSIKGTGDLTLTAVTLVATNVSVDASTASGTVTFTNGSNNPVLNYTGSIGSDIVTGGTAGDTFSTGTGNDTVTGLAGADTINVGTGNDTVVQGTSASGTYVAPATNTISTATFDVITGMGAGDKIDFTDVARTATSLNTLVLSAATDNTVVAVRGTYDATLKTFVGSATGVDTLVNYDTNITVGTVALEAIVLVGFVNTSTATSDALGVFTLG